MNFHLSMKLHSIGTLKEQDNLHLLENLLDMKHRMYNHYHQKLNKNIQTFHFSNSIVFRNTYNENENVGSIDDNEWDTKQNNRRYISFQLFIRERDIPVKQCKIKRLTHFVNHMIYTLF